MSGRLARWSSLVGATLVLVACGGTTPPAATGAGGGGGGATTPAATTPAATLAAGGGGGFSGSPCSLLTVAEIEGVIGVSGWTTQEFPMQNETGQCLYNAAASIVATSVTTGTTGLPEASRSVARTRARTSSEIRPIT